MHTNMHANNYSLRCWRKQGKSRDGVSTNARKKGMEQFPITTKKLVSNKEPILIFSASKIQKRERDTNAHTGTVSVDLPFAYCVHYFGEMLIGKFL